MDTTTGQVVTNDFAQITLDFSTEWAVFHRPGAPDLYPEPLREEIDRVNEVVFLDVNNGVICGVDVVVWPEASLSGYLGAQPHIRDSLRALGSAEGTAILFGMVDFVFSDPNTYAYFNAAILTDTLGRLGPTMLRAFAADAASRGHLAVAMDLRAQADASVGSRTEMRMAMMPMTTSSSTSVKPRARVGVTIGVVRMAFMASTVPLH